MKSWRVVGETRYPAGDNPFGNRFYGYRDTELVLPDGSPAKYHGLLVGDSVHIVAVEDDLTTYLVRQARPNLARPGRPVPVTLEIPGGFPHPDKSFEESARDELADEAGLRAETMELIGEVASYPGVSDEIDHIFMAMGLSTVATGARDATEQDMEIVSGPFGQLYDRIRRGAEPTSTQTLAAMSIAATRL